MFCGLDVSWWSPTWTSNVPSAAKWIAPPMCQIGLPTVDRLGRSSSTTSLPGIMVFPVVGLVVRRLTRLWLLGVAAV